MSFINNPLDVIIVGAGIAGLSCAREHRTLSDGAFMVLEACNWAGGRVVSVKTDDGVVLEMGAHYIHGTVGNPIYDFALSKDIIQKEDKAWKPYKFIHCFHNDVVQKTSEHTRQKAIDINSEFDLMSRCWEMDEMKNFKNVGDFVKLEYKKELVKYSHDLALVAALKSVFGNEIRGECDTNGCKDLCNLTPHIDYIDLKGDLFHTFNNNGYSDIVQALVDGFDSESCIVFNCVVNRIRHLSEKNVFEVSDTDGHTYYSRHIVFTVSIEVLKQFVADEVLVDLPDSKLKAIEKLNLGKVVKVYFKFSQPIEKGSDFMLFYPSHDCYDEQKFNGYMSVYCIERVNNSEYWLIWLNEELLPEISTKIQQEIDTHSTSPTLQSLLNELSLNYNNVPDMQVKENSIRVSGWTTDPFYLGSYSYLNQENSMVDIDCLAQPVRYGENCLYFAGELTDSRFYSTTHGAFCSGIREAKNVVEFIKNNKK